MITIWALTARLPKFCLQNMEGGTVHYYWRFLRTRGLAHRSLWSPDPDRGFLAPRHWREDAENTGPYMIQEEQLEVIDNYDKVLFWWTFPSVCLGFSCYYTHFVWECRCNGVVMGFCEKLWWKQCNRLIIYQQIIQCIQVHVMSVKGKCWRMLHAVVWIL